MVIPFPITVTPALALYATFSVFHCINEKDTMIKVKTIPTEMNASMKGLKRYLVYTDKKGISLGFLNTNNYLKNRNSNIQIQKPKFTSLYLKVKIQKSRFQNDNSIMRFRKSVLKNLNLKFVIQNVYNCRMS